jgi:hypothetical protein
MAAALLADELHAVESEVSQGRTRHLLKTLQERGTAQQLVRTQYSGRYPFELLQNANDAAAGQDSLGVGHSVRFVLTDTSLIVADKGRGFGQAEIEAICGLGRSSKDPGMSIGYKGLGFKSVGEITERPQIISGPVTFTFDEGRVREEMRRWVDDIPDDLPLPAYAFPFPLGVGDLDDDQDEVEALVGAGFRTVLRLPFRDQVSRDKVEGDLSATLTPRIVVLLDSIDRLEVRGTASDFKVERALQSRADFDDVLLDVDGAAEQWMVFKRKLRPPAGEMVAALGDAWAGVEFAQLSVGVQLGDDGRPTVDPSGRLFVYFPTQEKTGLPLLLHGDFALDLDRRYVSQAPEASAYNEWLAGELVQTLASVVAPTLAREFPSEASPLSVLSPRTSAADFGEEILHAYLAEMRRSTFVPCIDGSIRAPGETLLLPTTVPDHLSSVLSSFRYEGIDRLVLLAAHDDAAIVNFLTRLEADVMSPSELLERFDPPAEQRTELVLSWLVDWAEEVGVLAFARLLAEVPCVRTSSRNWVTPAERVFFPRERGAPELPGTLPMFVADLPEIDGLESLLREAGVQPFRWRELILGSVMPVLVSEDAEVSEREEAMDVLRAYFAAEGGDDREISSRARGVLVTAHDVHGTVALKPARAVYFSSAWTGSSRLEEIYAPFGAIEFLDEEAPDGQERDDEVEFLKWLGVRAEPRLTIARAESPNALLLRNIDRHPQARFGAWWDSWLGSEELRQAATCPQGHDAAQQQLSLSFGLDRFPELVTAGDRQRLRALFESIADAWTYSYSQAFDCELRCLNASHIGSPVRAAPSLLAHMMREADWVPGVADVAPIDSRPASLWRPVADMPSNVRRLLKVIDPSLDRPARASFLYALGIVDGARPSARDLAEILQVAATEWSDVGPERPIPRPVVETAHWAMRKLDEALVDAPYERLDDLPLLAHLAGQQIFIAKPYVADDPILDAIWSEELPILDADAGLRQLARAARLENLADRVEVVPEFAGPLPDRTREVERHMEGAAPFLAAAAYQSAPSREDAIRRLRSLSYLVCQQLSLVYRFDGREKRQAEEVAFLSSRNERSGSRLRRVGTAYLVSDASGSVDWYALGPLLAEFIEMPGQRDAFSLLLRADRLTRIDFLRSRNLGEAEVRAAAELLVRSEDEAGTGDLEGLLSGLDEEQDPVVGVVEQYEPFDDEEDGEHQTTDHPAEVPVALDLPPIDLSQTQLEDAVADAEIQLRGEGRGGGRSQPSEGREIDWETRERLSRAYGARGEEVAFRIEQGRVESLGMDPNAVVWESARNELSPYDIKSLDEDRQVIYIEVKSTAGANEGAPFEISQAELREAIRWGSRYYIYRVVEVTAPNPRVVRFRDPMKRVASGSGQLNVSGARMMLSNVAADAGGSRAPLPS